MSGALLVAGTTSDAGKSVLTAGICRWLARRGVAVAPFKAQNMSLNSMVTVDGAEIGRAQVMQAAAAGVAPEAAMNPVLLKPGSDHTSQVVVLGRPIADVDALSYRDLKPRLMQVVLESFESLRGRFDVIVCEGAGSPAEINLRDRDIANLGLARALDLPTIVVGDIDRGGVFASMFGTLAVLEPRDQALIAGFVVNKFRGDRRLLQPGIDMLTELTGRPTLGVLPWTPGLWLDAEDSLDLDSRPISGSAPFGEQALRVAVIRLPRLSNVTDIDALSCEPGVVVRVVADPGEIADADLVMIPGTRATVGDLAWLRENGLAAAIVDRARTGGAVIGVCGGYQMLCQTITDDVESHAGTVAGLGLLPASVTFADTKTLGRPTGRALGEDVAGYEIHHGIVTAGGDTTAGPGGAGEAFLDGWRHGSVWGTTWHGVFENDGFRRAFLRQVADLAGRRFVVAPDTSFAAVREARLDVLGDLVAEHLDTDALMALIDGGVADRLPTVESRLVD